MYFLLDTNIFIPLEPTGEDTLPGNTLQALEFSRLAQQAAIVLNTHPAMLQDITNDANPVRRELRLTLFLRYSPISGPPPVNILDPEIVPPAPVGSHDHVDNCLLAAVVGNACDVLITEDRNIHKKAQRLGVGDRVLLLAEAVDYIRSLFSFSPKPLPSVRRVFLHELDVSDPIFNSLKADYDGFDAWFARGQRERREAYVIYGEDHRAIAGIAILKNEADVFPQISGKTLKACTFKISDEHNGRRYGELLFRSVYNYAIVNKFKCVYFTTYSKQKGLRLFAESFGFYESGARNANGEIIMIKELPPDTPPPGTNPWSWHLKYGPGTFHFEGAGVYVVPIEPKFHERLFPDLREQLQLFAPEPCGNSIKKAYLCHAACRTISRGDILLFYRSHDTKAVTCIGVAEDATVHSDSHTIAQSVGSRTVYSFSEIEGLAKKAVLTVRFRYVGGILNPIALSELETNMLLNGPPQSISRIPTEKVSWLKTHIRLKY